MQSIPQVWQLTLAIGAFRPSSAPGEALAVPLVVVAAGSPLVLLSDLVSLVPFAEAS